MNTLKRVFKIWRIIAQIHIETIPKNLCKVVFVRSIRVQKVLNMGNLREPL